MVSVAVNLKVKPRFAFDPATDSMGRTWAGWDERVSDQVNWDHNRGRHRFSDRVDGERYATVSFDGRIRLVAELTGRKEESDPKGASRKWSLEGSLLPTGDPVREAFLKLPVPAGRSTVTYIEDPDVGSRAVDARSSGAVTQEALGAWVMKCNPAIWDLAGFIADGQTLIEDWTVVPNYRSDMVRYGHRVLLWVTGPTAGPLPRGFWGSGWITGDVVSLIDADATDSADPDAAVDSSYWLDQEAGARMRFAAPMNLRLWNKPVTETELLMIPGLDQLEVIRMRQVSNPSWISSDHLQLLQPLLPPWPEISPPADSIITTNPSNAAFGDPLTNLIVEAKAIKAVTEHYRAAHHTVTSVERDKCGWDLTCSAPDGTIRRVEVKGLSGAKPSILLTRNEHRSAQNDPGWELATVTRALTSPTVTIFSAEQALAAATPYIYQLNLNDPPSGR